MGGEIYAHLFENQLTGVRRNLFWNICAELEPVHLDGEDWDCSFRVDWLTWPICNRSELNGMTLNDVISPEAVEPSLYLLSEHNAAILHDLRLTKIDSKNFEASIKGSAQLITERGIRTVPLSIICELKFVGLIVVRDNLFPKPGNAAEAKELLAPFIDLEGLKPRSEEWRYIFEPA